ncbi:hypothetical protein L3X38_011242 [Prunus dulcis]|uniref:Integrase catalytic domain-containing protein n=1 Tax=Prunus dulcis TaxID=3755 RepID=A0AAD4WJI3_PRUDU|nr:hypothetical protein L3X38_011242 [Prunus dulcis]
MTGDRKLVVDIRTNVIGNVQMPTGELVNVAGIGTLVIDTSTGRKYIKEVMYLPGLKENLLSVGQMDEHDDCTRLAWVYFLRYKFDALNCFRKFKSMVELQSGFRVKCLRSDRGFRQLSMAYTPQQNEVVERKNRTVVEMAKAMLHEKGLPYYLWVEVVHTTVYILNRCPTRALGDKTPFEAYSRRKRGIAHLKIFGCLCYVYISSEVRQKLDAKSTKGIFVGYTTCEKGYRMYDPITKKLLLSRDIVFGIGRKCLRNRYL